MHCLLSPFHIRLRSGALPTPIFPHSPRFRTTALWTRWLAKPVLFFHPRFLFALSCRYSKLIIPQPHLSNSTGYFLNAIDVLGLGAIIVKVVRWFRFTFILASVVCILYCTLHLFMRPAQPILWGTLQKRGRVNTGWQKRLFVLQSGFNTREHNPPTTSQKEGLNLSLAVAPWTDGTIMYFNSVGAIRGTIQLMQVRGLSQVGFLGFCRNWKELLWKSWRW